MYGRAVACLGTDQKEATLDDEIRYRVMRAIEQNPHLSQRELAKELGVSLGKANYCIRALIEKGLVKARSFSGNPNKLAYAYILTPVGIEEKAHVTANFLRRKVEEYERLEREIANLRREVAAIEARE
jgi:EPS-associated MarR family transcriptional regulator